MRSQFCESLSQLSSQVNDYYEIWYERYATGTHLYPVLSNFLQFEIPIWRVHELVKRY
jgi:hypothetical protein